MSRELKVLVALALVAGFFAEPGPRLAARLQQARAEDLRGIELHEPLQAALAVSPGELPSGEAGLEAAETVARCTELWAARQGWTLQALAVLEPEQRAQVAATPAGPRRERRGGLQHTPGELTELLRVAQQAHGAHQVDLPDPLSELPQGLTPLSAEGALLAWAEATPLKAEQAWGLQAAALSGIHAHEALPDCLAALVAQLGVTPATGPGPVDEAAMRALAEQVRARLGAM